MVIKKGDKFNFLTAVKFVEMRKNSEQYWLFRCDCCKKKMIKVSSVKNGSIKSCGCLKIGRSGFKHGMARTRVYRSWADMRQRCLNKSNTNYKYYGGRGITICQEWINSFINFYKDMGERPKGKSIDRINNDGNYCKENCKWSTPKEQMNNTRYNKKDNAK